NAFPSDMQSAVRAQLADCLAGVICQRLRFRPDLKIRVPELEVLVPTYAVKGLIRSGDFYRIVSSMETGADQGSWTWQRYQNWLETRKQWFLPDPHESAEVDPAMETANPPPLTSAVAPMKASRTPERPTQGLESAPTPVRHSGRIEIEPVEGGLKEVIKKLEGP